MVASQVVLVVKNSPANLRDAGSISGSERSPGEGNGNPLQYSCLEKSMDRGTWQATVHGVAESEMTEHTHTHTIVALVTFISIITAHSLSTCYGPGWS